MESIFQPVRTRRTFEAVSEQIRSQLARGELRRGDRLPAESALAERFGISRTAVREALRSLEVSGLVEARKGLHGGFFIRSERGGGITQTVQDMVSLEQVSLQDVTEARVEFISVAIRLACARGTPEEFDAIQQDIDHHTRLFAEGGGSRNPQSVVEFYRLIARATHNEVIVMMVEALSEIIRQLLARIDPSPNLHFIEVRQRVLDHMRQRDATAATAAMAEHLRTVTDYLVSESGKRKAQANKRPN